VIKPFNKRIFLSPPHIGENEIKYVNDAFASNYIAPVGENINHFEDQIRHYAGASHALATSSGTAAIHLALLAAGVGPGDVVLCQSFTFAASANPIAYLGAIPVFIDSEEETWNMNPDFLEEAIKGSLDGKLVVHNERSFQTLNALKPKAILPVHLYGMPAKMDAIQAIASRYDIPVIEDAAEALGSSINGQFCGNFGDFGVYSFNGNKIITTSSGGMLLGKDKNKMDLSRKLSAQAREEVWHYEHHMIGYNYRMSNVLAGIGLGQMELLSDRITKRRKIFKRYKEGLKDISSISFLEEPEGYFSNRWLTTILIDTAKAEIDCFKIGELMDFYNVETRPLWKPLHTQPVFRSFPYFGNQYSKKLFEQGLCLPSGSEMDYSTQDMIIEILRHHLLK
jgi:dTDP-4-amino-4,6-dideoxygalactose transaminase